MTEPLDLDAIRARVEATSSDQWELVSTSTIYMNGREAFTVRMGGVPGIKATITAFPGDAELMVAARQDVPDLLRKVDHEHARWIVERSKTIGVEEQLDRERAELAEVLEQLHAGYNDRLNALSAELAAARAEVTKMAGWAGANVNAVRAVRAIHRQYRTPWTDEFDTCAGCNQGMELVPWPCPTIKAIEEAMKP